MRVDTTVVLEMGEDLDPVIKRLYEQTNPTLRYEDIAMKIGRSKDYVYARIKRMERRKEIVLRGRY
jgi:hypothetical protein